MTPSPDTARLLDWMPTVARWSGLTDRERRFCIGMRAAEKRNPAFQPSPGALRWMGEIVGRFQAATLRDEDAPAPQPWPYDCIPHTDPKGREEWPGGMA